jgi:hypothetical protein
LRAQSAVVVSRTNLLLHRSLRFLLQSSFPFLRIRPPLPRLRNRTQSRLRKSRARKHLLTSARAYSHPALCNAAPPIHPCGAHLWISIRMSYMPLLTQ